MELLPLHKHTHLMDACADILNAEWPRSKAARNHSLSKSFDKMPLSLAFIKRLKHDDLEVIGFSKLSAVQGIQNACLAESVIVREIDRGKGLGRVLMDLTEDYARKLGVKTMYLNTLDKEGFYTRLGYSRCKPVISLGANAHLVPETMIQKFMATSVSFEPNKEKVPPGSLENSEDSYTPASNSQKPEIAQSQSANPAPPPPPPPLLPPAKTSTASKEKSVSYSRTIIKMDPNSITWMKKDL